MAILEANEAPVSRDGFATGGVRIALRLEGLTVFAAAVLAYGQLGGNWWWFIALFLWPDLAFLAYVHSQRIGALVYNVLHSYVGPLVIGLLSQFAAQSFLVLFALIWAAHIGIDRFAGYGLKYPSRPDVTHLGKKGKKQSRR